MPDDPAAVLIEERNRLVARLQSEREQLEVLQDLVAGLNDRIDGDERMLEQIESALGKTPQLRLDEADIRLRGQRLEQIAIQILTDELGTEAEVHYREWFELVRARGHLIAGRKPVETFLSQIGRSPSIEKVGGRSGRYRLAERKAA